VRPWLYAMIYGTAVDDKYADGVQGISPLEGESKYDGQGCGEADPS